MLRYGYDANLTMILLHIVRTTVGIQLTFVLDISNNMFSKLPLFRISITGAIDTWSDNRIMY